MSISMSTQLCRALSSVLGDTGWTGASPVSSGEKIMNLALIKVAHLKPLGGGGWIM